MLKIVRLLVGVVLATLPYAASAGKVIHVPADQPTVQMGINASVNGDMVLVAPGTYFENINFEGKAIAVASELGSNKTIIDGGQIGTVVTFASGEGLASVLRGFTLQNGFPSSGASCGQGGGINITGASPAILENVIRNNSAIEGGGIFINGGSPVISGNVITNNNQSCGGGIGGAGIAIFSPGSAKILNNVISRNTLTSANGGGISLFSAGTPTVSGNVISQNTATGLFPCTQGGGVYVSSSVGTIANNLITANSAGCGGGIAVVELPNLGPLVINNTIANNPSPQGSGIYSDNFDAQVRFSNNIIVAASGQVAVFCGNGGSQQPILSFNNAFAPGGTAYGGNCAGQAGVNGNISADPLFNAPSSGDYHVKPGSPVIDAGSSKNAPGRDFDGLPRPIDGNRDGNAAFDMGAYEFAFRVKINIEPGVSPNTISLSQNPQIPVAILSSASFNASAVVDITSLKFGATGREASLASCVAEDVNGDGLPDLVCTFNTAQSSFKVGDKRGILIGATILVAPLAGIDSVVIVP
ncbi:MAG TPA: right-handed parallel beta-helix repeat-containing protein [Bryobacteraceae bacterium]|nr:right-handed parallel beta-helix repeat-containing protein [Bryobacteraceae bacterium]